MGREISDSLSRAIVGQAGLTLVELTVSIAVIGIALSGTLLAMSRMSRNSADPMIVNQATAVSEAYLEEILLRPFYDPDLGAGGGTCPAKEATRDLYDNVCDYNGLDDSGARDQEGNAVAGLESYRVRVTVDSAATINGLTGAAEVVRVDVRVTNGSFVDLTLSGYRTRY
jgi:MSHA pilin protein MshD